MIGSMSRPGRDRLAVKLSWKESPMAKNVSILVAALVVVAALGSGCGPGARGPAWDRWGTTVTGGAEVAEEELVTAYSLLYDLKVKEAANVYEEMVERLPRSPEAHLGLSMALRYQGKLDEAVAECEKALELDPDGVGARLNYADLLAPYRGTKLANDWTNEERIDRAIDLYKEVEDSDHPLAAYAHVGLWTLYIGRGEYELAKAELVELGRAKYSPRMLENFAHNMLAGLDENAILFTNGDNDTYPLLILQEADGVRQDVSVVNLSLLNLVPVVKLWRDRAGVPISHDDEWLDAFKPKLDSTLRRPRLLTDALVADIIRHQPDHGRPIYFALTCAGTHRVEYMNRAVLEGLAWRLDGEPTDDSIDFERVVENMTSVYRLEGLLDEEPWPANLSPLTRRISGLSINYAALYNRMADYYKESGETDKVLDCFRSMFSIVEPTGRKDLILMVLTDWFEFAPEDEEVLKLREEHLGAS